MSGGLIAVRGNAGLRVGGGMTEDYCRCDMEIDRFSGMTGGKIIVNGRC